VTKKKPEKPASEMNDDELIKTVFPPHVVERIRREHHLDEPVEEPREADESGSDAPFTPQD
jgi:hypothetical protein